MRHFQYLRGPKQIQASPQKPVTKNQNLSQFSVSSAKGNISNDWRMYAKMEANHHLSNKFALFYNMRYYYKSIGRDPFEVLPLTFHVSKGTYDP